jgi:hypothetical protein
MDSAAHSALRRPELVTEAAPPEAHRRFRADLAAKHDRNQQERATQLALHEEKKCCIGAWIAEHGTPEQQARQAADVLPMEEAIEAITDQAFAAIRDHSPYARDGAERPQAPTLTLFGALVTQKVGPFVLRREYAAANV